MIIAVIRNILVMIITLIYSDIINCLDLETRHELDPENLQIRSLKIRLFQIMIYRT